MSKQSIRANALKIKNSLVFSLINLHRKIYKFIVLKKEYLPISDKTDWLESSIKEMLQGTEKKFFFEEYTYTNKWHPISQIILQFTQVEWECMQAFIILKNWVLNEITYIFIRHFTTDIILFNKTWVKQFTE